MIKCMKEIEVCTSIVSSSTTSNRSIIEIYQRQARYFTITSQQNKNLKVINIKGSYYASLWLSSSHYWFSELQLILRFFSLLELY